MPDRNRELHVRITADVDPSFKKAVAYTVQLLSSIGVINDVANRAAAPVQQLGSAAERSMGRSAQSAKGLAQALRDVFFGYERIVRLQGGTTLSNITTAINQIESLVRRQGAALSPTQSQRLGELRELQHEMRIEASQASKFAMGQVESKAHVEDLTRSLRAQRQEMSRIESEAIFQNQARRLQFGDIQSQAIFENRARDLQERARISAARRSMAGLESGAIFENRARDLQERARISAARRSMAGLESGAIFENRAEDRLQAQVRAALRQGMARIETEAIFENRARDGGIQGTTRQVRSLMDEIRPGHVAAWALQWNLVYAAINQVTQAINAVTFGAARLQGEFQTRVIRLAADIQNIKPDLPFAQALTIGKSFALMLDELAPRFFGTRQQLELMLESGIRFGVVTDLTTKKAREDFLTLANAIALVTQGQRLGIQAIQEMRDLSLGILRPQAALLQQLRATIGPDVQKKLLEASATGRLPQFVSENLPGVRSAQQELQNTLEGSANRFGNTLRVILRDAGKPLADELTSILQRMEKFLAEHRPGATAVAGAATPVLGTAAVLVALRLLLPRIIGAAAAGSIGGPIGIGTAALGAILTGNTLLGAVESGMTANFVRAAKERESTGGRTSEQSILLASAQRFSREVTAGQRPLASTFETQQAVRDFEITKQEASLRALEGQRQLTIEKELVGVLRIENLEKENLSKTTQDLADVEAAIQLGLTSETLNAAKAEELEKRRLEIKRSIQESEDKLATVQARRFQIQEREFDITNALAALKEQKVRRQLEFEVATQQATFKRERKGLEEIAVLQDADIVRARKRLEIAQQQNRDEKFILLLQTELSSAEDRRLQTKQGILTLAIRERDTLISIAERFALSSGAGLTSNLLRIAVDAQNLRRQFSDRPRALAMINETERNERERVAREFRFGQEDVRFGVSQARGGILAEGGGALAQLTRTQMGAITDQLRVFQQFGRSLAQDLPAQFERSKTKIEAYMKSAFNIDILKLFEKELKNIVANLDAYEANLKRIASTRQAQSKAEIDATKAQKEATQGQIDLIDKEIEFNKKRRAEPGLSEEERIKVNQNLVRLETERARLMARGTTEQAELERQTRIAGAQREVDQAEEAIVARKRELERRKEELTREFGKPGAGKQGIAKEILDINSQLQQLASGIIPADLLGPLENTRKKLAEAIAVPSTVASQVQAIYSDAAKRIQEIYKEIEEDQKRIQQRNEDALKKFKDVIDEAQDALGQFHGFFKSIFDSVGSILDKIAEKMRGVVPKNGSGGYSPGGGFTTPREFYFPNPTETPIDKGFYLRSSVIINGLTISGSNAEKIQAIIQSEVFGSRGADEASFQASRLGPRQAVG